MTIVSNVVALSADRHEVENAMLWDNSSGSDFFFEPDAAQIAGTGTAEDLSDRGWTTSGMTFVGGGGGDFLATADKGTPGHYLLDAANDRVQSPYVFGDFVHGHQAGHHLGDVEPTKLVAEFWATFATASNNETASAIGFAEAGGAINVAGEQVAAIYSDGTNFGLRSSADSDAGALIDTNIHLWRIEISQGTTDAIEWFIDGTSQGTIDGRTDVYPVAFGAGILVTTGANDIRMGAARIYYR